MSKSILVIDDDLDIRESFAMVLDDAGYQVDTAATGEEGIEKERNKKYDLIFLDLRMPGINGIKVFQEIRKKNKETPIYIITAFHKDFFSELNEIAKKGEAFELIKKPVRNDQILMIVKSIFEGPVIF